MKTFATLLLALTLALAAAPPRGGAARFAVTVTGVTTTSRQAVIKYTAPSSSACAVEVSLEADYTPLIDDVNSTLFSGANLDSREGSLIDGTSHTFVAGHVPLEQSLYPSLASDGRHRSRTLQANTTHYYRITCGAETAAGTFDTKNISAGKTYPEPRPVQAPGVYGFPSWTWNRTTGRPETAVDPTTGMLYTRLGLPRDYPSDDYLDQTFTTASGTNWASPTNVTADDSNSASYTAGTQDWLYLDAPTISPSSSDALHALKLWLKANATGTGDNAVLQMCVTLDGGSTCAGDTKEITLSAGAGTQHCYPHGAAATDCAAAPAAVNTWAELPTTIRMADVRANAGFGFRVRKKGTGAGTINIQYAKFDAYVDYTPYNYDNGAQWVSSYDTVNDSAGAPGYLVAVRNTGIGNTLYWVNAATGANRFLGRIFVTGAGFGNTHVGNASATWDASDPRLFYTVAADDSGNAIAVRGQLPASGSTYYDADAAAGANASFTWTNLTSAPNHLKAKIDAFDPTFTPADFNCSASTVQAGYLMGFCRRGNQDSIAYMWGLRLSDNAITAVTPTWKNAKSRWCGHHTEEPAAPTSEQYVWVASELRGPTTGQGPYQVTLNGAINDSQTTITVTSGHSTPGQPFSANAPAELQNVAVGDVVVFNEAGDYEAMIVTAVNSATSWGVTRGYGLSIPRAHANASVGRMTCVAQDWAEDQSQSGNMFWDWLDDTTGADTTNVDYIRDNSNISGGHHAYHFPFRISAAGGWTVQTITSDQDPVESNYAVTDSPLWEGLGATRASGNSYQKHPAGNQQLDAAAGEQVWGADILPQVNDPVLNPSGITNVTGSLWKFTNASGLNRKKMPTQAACGVKPLVDISSAATGNTIGGLAADNYTYCVAAGAGECRTGSSAGDIFVNCPGLSGTPTCFQGGENLTLTDPEYETEICLGDSLPYGQQLVQFDLRQADSLGERARTLGHMLTPHHRMHATASPKALPNGKLMLLPWLPGHNRLYENLLALMPPWPSADAVDRNNFIQTAVTLAAVGGADNAIVEFGYNDDLECTSRQEVCVSAGSNNPYFFAGESFTGVSCASGCTVSVPTIPGRVVYYRVKYRSGTSTVQTSQIAAFAEGSGSQEGGGGEPPAAGRARGRGARLKGGRVQ